MTGTLVNTGAVLLGSAIGISMGTYIPERIKTVLMQALGLAVIVVGLKMALSGTQQIAYISCLLLGALTGEIMRIEQGVETVGHWLKKRFNSNSATFVEGFVTSSVLYLTGAMMIVGCIQDGTVGDHSTLFIKSLLDGVASIALASSLGIGVAFSALSVFIVQGFVTLLSAQLVFLQEPAVLEAVTATGGLIILGIGFNLLGFQRIRVGNFLPAILYAIIYPLLMR